MTVVLHSLPRELHLDFARAREELADARRRQWQKDTPQHRSAVAACLTRIDAVLDMYLESVGLPV
jgi:hypothetical protein